MISWIYYCGFVSRILVYSLPLVVFGMSSYIRLAHAWLPYVNLSVPRYYLVLLLLTECVWILATNYFKVSPVSDLFWEDTGIWAAFLACFASFLLQTVLLVFVDQLMISRTFIVLSNAILFLCVVATGNLFRLIPALSNLPRRCEKILVVGTDQYALRSVNFLRRIPFLDCEVQAYLQLPGQPVLVQDAPVISTAEPLDLETLSFDGVVAAIPANRYPQVSSLLDSLRDVGKPVRAILDLGPRLSIRERLFQVSRAPRMHLAIYPVESFAYTVLKRILDLFLALVGAVVLSPVLLALAVVVKLSSPGPILFRQERVGRNGKLFMLLKFRTMQRSATAESDTMWTTKNDPRCTVIGAALRKYSLDELPQLFNVIRGDMSLVGPRPERPYFVAKFRKDVQKYNRRHCCHVGMTGWAQVNGLRGNTSIPERLRYDLYYIYNWSLVWDMQIIVRTMFTVLRDQNGY
jgi:exopolysaccharide biosynthesis polyprenyl glycosylphosphotransferase